jgi:hypothetical protein
MIKGSALREFVHWYGERRGRERLVSVIDGLPDAARASFQRDDPYLGMVSSAWYPAPSVHALIDALTVNLSPAERKAMAHDAAQTAFAATVKGVYKLLFETLMSPPRYLKNAQKLFSRYFNTGLMTKTALAPNKHRTVVTEWTSHHPVLCEIIVHTGVYVYGAMGCQEVVHARESCISDGAASCSFVVSWK